MGTLKVTGTINTQQIWPNGRSDADTVRVQVDGAQDGFFFRAQSSGAFKRTRVFEHGFVKGRFGLPQSPISKGKVTIRMQGIDSPELHYRPEALPAANTTAGQLITAAQRAKYHDLNKEYRQKQGETSSSALHDLLNPPGGASVLPCTVVTQVDLPGEPFDAFHRLVGDVLVKIGGKEININQWLCRNGWTLPAFYDSMTNAEITVLRTLCNQARKQNKGLWPLFSNHVSPFDFALQYENPKLADINLAKDKGKFITPKLYRRQTTYAARKGAGIFTGSLQAFVASQHKSFVPIDLFLLHGKNGKLDFLEDHLHQNNFDLDPDQLVFVEDRSTLVAAPSKTAAEITSWF